MKKFLGVLLIFCSVFSFNKVYAMITEYEAKSFTITVQNIDEKIEKIDVVTISELAKILNVNQTRLKNDLLKITINDELAVGLFIKKDGTHIYVNPSIYYKGNNIDDLKALIDMFRTKKKGCGTK